MYEEKTERVVGEGEHSGNRNAALPSAATAPYNTAYVAVSIVLVVLWALFIFWMSASDGDTSQGYSDSVAEVVAPYVVPGYDELAPAAQEVALDALSTPVRKLAHAFEYAVLGVLVCNLCWQLRRRRASCTAVSVGTGAGVHAVRLAALSWACCAAYAVTDELHQLFSAGRSAQPFDVGVDAAGALVGVLLATVALARWTRRV